MAEEKVPMKERDTGQTGQVVSEVGLVPREDLRGCLGPDTSGRVGVVGIRDPRQGVLRARGFLGVRSSTILV